MEIDNDLQNVVLGTQTDFWPTDKKQRFLNIENETPAIYGRFSSMEIARFIQSNWDLERTKKDLL